MHRCESRTPVLTVLTASALLQLRAFRSSAHLVIEVVQPAALLLVVLMLGRTRGIDGPAAALAAGLLSLWAATIWQSGLILRFELTQGTLPGIIVRRASFLAVLIGKTLGTTVRSVVVIGTTVSVISFAFGSPPQVQRPGLFALALLACVLSTVLLGLLLSSLFILTRAAGRIAETLMYPVFILGGILIPLELFPGVLHPLAELVSLYRGGEVVRAAAGGVDASPYAWLGLGVTTVGYAVLAVMSLNRVLHRARQEGTLDLY